MTRCTGRKRSPLTFGHADVSVVVRRVSTTKLGRTELRHRQAEGGVMGDRPFGHEAYELLADFEGAESADADVEFVRQQRRLRGEPSMSRKEAVWRANQHLRAES
jgi:hypothetical protein